MQTANSRKYGYKLQDIGCSLWKIVTLVLVYYGQFTYGQSDSAIELLFSVAEDAAVGSVVGQLPTSGIIIDHDPNFRTYFDADSLQSNGTIITTNVLDHETNPNFVVSIFANIGTIFKVEINVTDVNDNSPMFPESSISLHISEASQFGSKFDIGSATDDDASPNNVKGYQIVGGNSEQFFRIGTRTLNDFVFADLIVNKSLNREEIPFFTLTVEAFDGGNPPRNGSVTLNINITDVNDNAPMFDLTRYTVTINENSPVGTDVINLTASDLDINENGEITYRIDHSQSDPERFFIIDSTTGQITLHKRLDFEQKVQHKIVVEAVDKGSEPQVGSTVVIVAVGDVNDNNPVLDIIFLNSDGSTISEAARPGDYIARVSVSDPDLEQPAKFNVTLSGGDDKFDLETSNNVTFLISVKNRLDREIQSSHHITLTATDFGSSPLSTSVSYTLTVGDINDNPPEFEQDLYQVSLDETLSGTFVTQLQATDPDEGINAEVTYSLASTNQSDWFTINEDSGLITTRITFDSSINPSPRLVVIATDKGTPSFSANTTLVVSIAGSNSSVPKFDMTSYTVTVLENITIGECVLQVRASSDDAFSILTYSIASATLPSQTVTQFRINATTGDICVTSSLDKETRPRYDFEIRAAGQNGRYGRALVHVIIDDVNEFAPVFHPVTYMANVDQNASADFPITKVFATDDDDVTFGQITYSLTSGNEEGLFELDSVSGQLSVVKSLEDVNIGTTYHVVISATDERGMLALQSANVTITIVDSNVSSEGPMFSSSSYHFIIDEDVAVLTIIGGISASSRDGTIVSYQIRDDPPNTSWFSINPSTGELMVSAEMDREIFSNVTFEVIASSGISPLYAFVSVTVELNDVNDNSPHFYDSLNGVLPPLTIPYSLPVGTVLRVLQAVDADAQANGRVEYSLSSAHFGINATNGYLRLISTLPQQNNDYLLTIESRDHGVPPRSTMTSLTIHVRRPDVNCPVFTQSSYAFHISENHQLYTSFGTLNFSTSHNRAVLQVVGASSAPFAVFSNGSLYLDQRIDRELNEQYQFEVVADGVPTLPEYEQFCTASTDVTVTVDDVNDNPPQFNETAYIFSIEENLPAGTKVGSVFASDRDLMSRITYQFAVTNSQFEVHRDTGVITTLTTLDYEATNRFNLLVEAGDGENLAQVMVHVNILDTNDNSPKFVIETGQLAVVLVGSEPGTWVADMKAVDPDSAGNGAIVYALSGSTLFKIGESSGIVEINSLLTEDEIGPYTLSVNAEDQGIPARSASVDLLVNVHSSSGNPAQFSDTQFTFSPLEAAEIGDVLGSFESTSRRARQLSSSYPSYRIVSGNDAGFFAVSESIGDLVLRRKLNYESSPQYVITVEKRESNGVTTLSAQINIRDVNDHTPTFTSGLFNIGVDENVQIGEEVWRFKATDADSGLDGEIDYSLVFQDPVPAFTIHSGSGALIVDGVLDRENISAYLLVINATDRSTTSPRFSTASCVVTLRDVNDNAPQFVNRDVTYVMEDEPIGSPLIHFNAHDPDIGANGHVTYSLASIRSDRGSGFEESFHLDPVSGILTLTDSLDHERVTTYHLNVLATDGSSTHPLTTYQNFTIHVININDAAPRFERLLYEAEVAEGQSSGVLVTRVTAFDADAGVKGQVRYSLQDSSDSENFTIDSINGVITTLAPLDREERWSYTLTVFAEDNSVPSRYDWTTINVTVADINDNPPRFTPLDDSTDPPTLIRLEVPEQSDGPMLIHVLSAYDKDKGENGRIAYSIIGGDESGDFFVNSTSGELWTTRQLDREQTSSYRLEVAATDHGESALADAGIVEVTVLDWNDNDPQFEKAFYIANVTEGMSRGQYVVTVRADDADEGVNRRLRYFLAPQSSTQLGGFFDIDINTGVITTTAIIDRESVPVYRFIVTAVDCSPSNPRNSSVPLIVNVIDVNDNPPVFDVSDVHVGISRTEQVGAVIGHVAASDQDIGNNGRIVYNITGTSDEIVYFSIDFNSGDLVVERSLGALLSPYYLIVSASDQGNPPKKSEAVVLITAANGPAPRAQLEFEQTIYERNLWETTQEDLGLVTVKANVIGSSDDISDVTYEILSGNEEGRLFSISQDGAITVSDPSLLDFETKPKISLFISASALDIRNQITLYDFTTVNVTIRDDNDNTPKFSQLNYYARVWEEQSPSFVMQLFASDADSETNGEIRFDLEADFGAFSIDPMTGFLQTTRSLDREIHDKYELVVHATDQGDIRKTGTCTVNVDVVDINDHQPRLVVPTSPILIPEDTDVGKMVARATANDVDANQILTFYFSSQNGNPGNHFSVDRYGGQIFLTSALDYELLRNITLLVETSDGVFTTSSPLEIVIDDVNDNRPVFSQSVYHTSIEESSPVGKQVLSIEATDLDSGENGRISYRILNTLPNQPTFRINSTPGVISINQSQPFSSHTSVYNLEVEAFDHGNPAMSQSVSVRIEIVDVNDHPPEFSSSIYNVDVTESAPRDFSVINVTATDADYASENKNVYYQIVSGNVGGAFKILTNSMPGNQAVGEIRTVLTLDKEVQETFELTVTAFDRGRSQLSSNVTVRVRVRDVNDNKPRFNASRYYGNVTENNEESEPRVPIPVVSMFASDADESTSSNFKFLIISGNDGDQFELGDCTPQSGSCVLLLAKWVDFESKPMHHLTIKVRDNSDPVLVRSDTTEVLVYVQNTNEYPPVVEQFVRVHIEETVQAGQTILHIAASDRDAGYYGRITFSVLNDGSNGVGAECPLPHNMFVIQDVTGALSATHDFDFEKCRSFSFRINVCDPDFCIISAAEINILPVDEFPPQFVGVDPDLGFQFFAPYGSPPGFIVGAVSAVDEDTGEDGRIQYSLEESSSLLQTIFIINETSGVISLSRAIDNGNAHILTLTAASRNRKSTTHVTVAITDVPAMTSEAVILAIVFGIIAAIAVLIVVVLCWRRRRKAYKSSEATESTQDASQAKGYNSATMRKSSNRDYYGITNGHAVAQLGTANGVAHRNDQKQKKMIGNGAAGDFQLQTIASLKRTMEGKKKPVSQSEAGTMLFKHGAEIDSSPYRRHRTMASGEPPHTGNDGSAEDEEVDRITSTPSSSDPHSSSSPFLSVKQRGVSDSGIQQDMDKLSDDTVTSRPQHQATRSIKSIHDFGVQGGEDDVFDLPGLPPALHKLNSGRGEEVTPSLGDLGTRLKPPRSGLLSYFGGLESGDNAFSGKSGGKEWTPDFQPLSSVFSEIARLRGESIDEEQFPKQMHSKPKRSKTNSPGGLSGPPPLLTSMPPKAEKLTAPIPLSTQVPKPGTHVPLRGFYPRPVPQYHHTQGPLAPSRSHAALPLYSLVMSSRPSSGGSVRSQNSRSSQHSQIQGPAPLSLPPSISGPVSTAPSLSRTSLSHDSSLTSPAMSPSLSPSLTPLTPHSPTHQSANHRDLASGNSPPDVITVIRSHSRKNKPKERMVHV